MTLSLSDTRGQRVMERKMAAKRIDTELREWRREVEQYNKKVGSVPFP